MPSTLSACAVDDRRRTTSRGRVEVVASPSSRPAPGRTSSPEPVQDHRPLEPAPSSVAVDRAVVVGAARRGGQRAARHQDHLRARRPRRTRLLLVGARGRRPSVAGPGAAGRCPRRRRAARRPPAPRRAERRISSLRRGPVEAHAALRGVHRLGDAAGRAPTGAGGSERRLPVQLRRAGRVAGRQRVGDDVGGGERPRERGSAPSPGSGSRATGSYGSSAPSGARQRSAALTASAPARRPSAARATTARRARRAARPCAPSRKSHGNGSSSTTWRRNCSHCTLKPLSNGSSSGHLDPRRAVVDRGPARSGFQTALRRGRRAAGPGTRAGPATALPCVPSTCSSNSSSRLTRTHQDELICTISAAVELEHRVGGVLGGRRRTASPASSTRSGMCVAPTAQTERTGAEHVVEHVAPVGEHVDDDPAAVLGAVVPRRPLRLRVALEDPVAELAAHGEDAPEEAAVDQPPQLAAARAGRACPARRRALTPASRGQRGPARARSSTSGVTGFSQ